MNTVLSFMNAPLRVFCASALLWPHTGAGAGADAAATDDIAPPRYRVVDTAMPMTARADYVDLWGLFALVRFREQTAPGDGVAMLERELRWTRALAQRARDQIDAAFDAVSATMRAQTGQLCHERQRLARRDRLGVALAAHDEAVQQNRRLSAQQLQQLLDPDQMRQLQQWLATRLQPNGFARNVDYAALVTSGHIDPEKVLQSLCADHEDGVGGQ